jgi:succinoglycan biosynthesis protein ExoM
MLPHISVCVPTYKRPQMLARCLGALTTQEQRDFTYSIVVVDNDAEQSAKSLVKGWESGSATGISYVPEPEQNISRARNTAVANAHGEYVAFIDDDEFPEPAWLLTLYETCQRFSVDGVLGPVLPHYAGTPPDWLVRSGLCVRSSFPTGTALRDSRYMRTGNVLFRKRIVEELDAPFDPRLGRSGGEDADFFDRMLAAGRTFVWCDEARVREEVPVERQTVNYHLKRAFIRGVTEADKEPLFSFGTVRSSTAVVVYTIALPVLLATRYHLYVRYLVRCCDHLAKLLAHAGIRLARERTF